MKRQIYLAILLVILLLIFYVSYLYVKESKKIIRRIERVDNIIYELPVSRAAKKEDAAEPEDKGKRPEEYYKKLERHNNDTQNVHNSTIISGLSRKLTRLKDVVEPRSVKIDGIDRTEIENIKAYESISQIKRYAKEYFAADKEKWEKVRFALHKIKEGHPIISINTGDALPHKESYILALIWERIHHNENSSKADDMKVALLDNIVDAVSTNRISIFNVLLDNTAEINAKYRIECITGRVGRMISSLTLLDADEILAEPEKDEKEFENEAYYKAYNILQNRLTEDKIEDVYTGNRETMDKQQLELLEKFENSVKEQIKESLSKDYENLLDKATIDAIIQKAQQGV